MPRFRAAHTQVLGVSVDSVFCHANWGKSLGGVSFPLLGDFHPKGSVAQAYGLYLDDVGITDRATVIIDASGVVRHSSSVGPGGRRTIADLAALCEGVDKEHGAGLADFAPIQGLARNETLFVKSSCGFSRKVLLVRENLHLQDVLPVKNVSDDAAAQEQLINLIGSDQAPCLAHQGGNVQESDDIVRYLVANATDLG